MGLTCKIGSTNEVPKMRAMTTASTIWLRCWFNPPSTTTTKNFSFCATMLTEAFRYSVLTGSMQGTNLKNPGCFQNSDSVALNVRLLLMESNAEYGVIEFDVMNFDESAAALGQVRIDIGCQVKKRNRSILAHANRVRSVIQQLLMWARLPNLIFV